ncbi:prepilin-type N-terminal cleavage/methylation domain-containing protein [Methylobacterium sp. 17Sr1-1]|uniref:prepilin-type N-terminal cleavage/methylation domain-containing protein n=1 Tax=Methylobacterium sp. 17Sr1-1 TaxID=2202826 RepID=UPI000D6F9726|nr:prepilin-type N-terminal cleavage/methylation domain-containing protein [Methylobacterium sp. 17Sr1-1]AWN54785.1 general secretion pathway protein GspH [Methylobacterium sp. 17Sr1-1]
MDGNGGRESVGQAGFSQAGFTLVEMLVTMAIMGLAAGVAFQSLGPGALDRRTLLVSETVAAEIGRLRAEAIRTGRAGRLAFEPQARLFTSSRPGAPPIPVGGLAVAVEPGPVGRPVPGEVRLMPDGSSTGGRILLAGGGTRRALSVSALTGRVRREDGP